ncbi:MAG: tRNA (adenosine(37)-N6)-threonylcarbamoyltransferase complex ATPase subunit type 1 TsaE [Firmicutes bacterium]|nr:tRNA (adenosine(37)-N6)-threonylcarbamoyltransferase complex ATPase subunit type 1 TsaE [Bacillota bacterium]MDH7494538.1 tRNA (adenosine(37)-N6)-threonylcarbamoyltransferase complex ATPase subunit type 1 TsaE [Bacillota bacterium]
MYRACSPRDTRKLGEALGRLLGPGDVVCLEGHLGAGKTVFVQGLAAGMEVKGRVTSPTFTIVHEHPGKVPLYHIDAYRLEGVSDAETAGIDECLYGGGAAAVEWPERIRHLLPEERLDVEIRIPPDGDSGADDGDRDGDRIEGNTRGGRCGDGEGPNAGGTGLDGCDCDEGSSAREIVFLPRGERFRCMIEELRALAGPGY